MNIEKMQAEYDAMSAQKIQLRKTFQMAEKEVVEADRKLKNIRQYLGIERENQNKQKIDRKHETSL